MTLEPMKRAVIDTMLDSIQRSKEKVIDKFDEMNNPVESFGLCRDGDKIVPGKVATSPYKSIAIPDTCPGFFFVQATSHASGGDPPVIPHDLLKSAFVDKDLAFICSGFASHWVMHGNSMKRASSQILCMSPLPGVTKNEIGRAHV